MANTTILKGKKNEKGQIVSLIATDGTVVVTPQRDDADAIQVCIKDNVIAIVAGQNGVTASAAASLRDQISKAASELGTESLDHSKANGTKEVQLFLVATKSGEEKSGPAAIASAVDKFIDVNPSFSDPKPKPEPEPEKKPDPKPEPAKKPEPEKKPESKPEPKPNDGAKEADDKSDNADTSTESDDFWAEVSAPESPDPQIGQDGLLDVSGYYTVYGNNPPSKPKNGGKPKNGDKPKDGDKPPKK